MVQKRRRFPSKRYRFGRILLPLLDYAAVFIDDRVTVARTTVSDRAYKNVFGILYCFRRSSRGDVSVRPTKCERTLEE